VQENQSLLCYCHSTWWCDGDRLAMRVLGRFLKRAAPGNRVGFARRRILNHWFCWSLAHGDEDVLPRDLHRFCLVALGLRQAIMLRSVACVCCFYAVMRYLDKGMLSHERVGSWMVVNTWWYERGGSYPVTLVWRYEWGRFVCFMLTLERCCVRGGT